MRNNYFYHHVQMTAHLAMDIVFHFINSLQVKQYDFLTIKIITVLAICVANFRRENNSYLDRSTKII
jgi:hypothetical protein